jgi:hypothetical protein
VPEDGGQLEGVGLLLEAEACSSVTQGKAVLSQLLHTIPTITISCFFKKKLKSKYKK